MNKNNELKCCPFCGGDAEVAYCHGYYVRCKKNYCCTTRIYNTEAEVIQVWNTRKEAKEELNVDAVAKVAFGSDQLYASNICSGLKWEELNNNSMIKRYFIMIAQAICSKFAPKPEAPNTEKGEEKK